LTEALVKVIVPVPAERGVILSVYTVHCVDDVPSIAPAKEGSVVAGVSVYTKLHGLVAGVLMPVTDRFAETVIVASAALNSCPPPSITTSILNGSPTTAFAEAGAAPSVTGEGGFVIPGTAGGGGKDGACWAWPLMVC
jgi:hypothetical protein